jgi:hypothetical protein
MLELCCYGVCWFGAVFRLCYDGMLVVTAYACRLRGWGGGG